MAYQLVNTWTEVDSVTTGLKADVAAGKVLSENDYTDSDKARLADTSGSNTGDQDLSGYQPIEAGKGLSENDYIDADKAAVTALDSMSTKGEWYGTQAEYEALGAWEAETYYYINDVV